MDDCIQMGICLAGSLAVLQLGLQWLSTIEGQGIQEPFSPRYWMSQLLFGRHWNPEEAGRDASEGNGLASESEGKQARSKTSFFRVFYTVCLQEARPSL